MIVAGALVNAGVSLVASACYGFVSVRLLRRRQAFSTPLFMGIVAVFLFLASIRQVAAGFQNVALDRTIFLVNLFPAAYSIVPLMFVVGRIRSEQVAVARWLTFAFLVATTVGLVFAYLGGITGPTTSDWGTDWTVNSLVTRVTILLAILVPGVVAAAYLIRVGRRVRGATGRRATLLGWSCGVFYIVFTADAFGLSGIPLVTARLLTAFAAILAYLAYARDPEGHASGANP